MATRHDEGDVPGIGRYKCTECGWVVRLDDRSDKLPRCGDCDSPHQSEYRRISRDDEED